MINSPLFSVIIPTYNRAEALKRCLESLVAQSFKNFEVIVCDDGSTDHSKQIVKEFENTLSIKYFWNENWGGPARPRNIGIKNASADWICFLDSDDWWYPNKLEYTARYIDKYDLIYHLLDTVCNGITRRKRLRRVKKDAFRDLLVEGNTIPNSSVSVKKVLLEKVGALSEDKKLIAIEDYDLWLKISNVSNKFYLINKSLGAYWVGDAGKNISFVHSEKMLEREMCVYEKYKSNLTINDKCRTESRIYRFIAENNVLFKDNVNAAKYYLKALRILISLKSFNDVKTKFKLFCYYIRYKKK